MRRTSVGDLAPRRSVVFPPSTEVVPPGTISADHSDLPSRTGKWEGVPYERPPSPTPKALPSDNASQPFRRPHVARHHPSAARVASAFPRTPPGRLAPQGTRLLLGPHSPSTASNPADKPRLRPTTGGSRRGSCVSH